MSSCLYFYICPVFLSVDVHQLKEKLDKCRNIDRTTFFAITTSILNIYTSLEKTVLLCISVIECLVRLLNVSFRTITLLMGWESACVVPLYKESVQALVLGVQVWCM